MTRKVTYDVLVAGAGLAGISAALAAARNGARTLLVERHPYCGGAFTAGMVLHIAGLIDHRRICRQDDMTLNSEKWIVRGLATEYYDRLCRIGAARGPHWDHEPAKMVFDEMLQQAGVDVLYGTQFFSADVVDNRIRSAELVFRTSKVTVEAKLFVDATGDGDLGASAGVEFCLGRESDHALMPATLSYLVAGVAGDPLTAIDDANRLLAQAWQSREIPPDMRPAVIVPRFAQGRDRNELWCSVVRQWGNVTDPWEYSRMERVGRKIGWEIFNYLKHALPAWRDAYLASVGHQIWPRESRHLHAQYILSEDDVRGRAHFPDVVARGGFYLDLHSATPHTTGFDLEWQPEEYDTYFEIPYRSLVACGVGNLFLAGRTIGADHVGHSATRVMGTGIATGQAAGTAAALCVRRMVPPMDLDPSRLQETLRRQGVII